jgi:hypothetical protein
VTITMPAVAETRARMIAAYREGLAALIEDATVRIGEIEDLSLADDVPTTDTQADPAEDAGASTEELEPEEAVEQGLPEEPVGQAPEAAASDQGREAFRAIPVLTRLAVDQALNAIFSQPIPMPDELAAEVHTPAIVYVWAVCPRCGLAQPISMTVHPELLIDDSGSELRIKAKAKGRTHICGQMPLPVSDEAEGQQELPLDEGGDQDADPEPADSDEPSADDIADMEGMAEPHPEDKGNGSEDDDLLPGEPEQKACVRSGGDCVTHDATWPEVATSCWGIAPPPRKRGAS